MWTHIGTVVKILMAGDEDLLFMDKSNHVQNGEEIQKSEGQVFLTFLNYRLEPELTGKRPEMLATFVKFYKYHS